ncbi:MAG: diguanylate cyclase [Halioglobus sp.]|nr:diguanylate cyclase [Halioglobus sp.]
MKKQDDRLRQALARCADEPVQQPGAIQPAGFLFAVDAAFDQVTHASAGLERYLDVDARGVLGESPESLFGRTLLNRLRESLCDERLGGAAVRTRIKCHGRSQRYQLFAYPSGDHVVVEAERLERSRRSGVLGTVNDWLSYFAGLESRETLTQALVDGVRLITAYDRVLLYVFDRQWNGQVEAESLAPGTEGFLHHRFPSTDIPEQVRALYAINPVRAIVDGDAGSEPVLALDNVAAAPLDLSPGVLRAVSPVHAQYLANMGVRSSFSIALEDRQGLWGLLSGHAQQPRQLSPPVRDACRVMVQMANQRLALLKARREAAFLEQVRDSRGQVADWRGQVYSPRRILTSLGPDWLQLMQASGCALLVGEEVACCGRSPDPETLRTLRGWLNQQQASSNLWQTHATGNTPLGQWLDPAVGCGVLAASLPLGEEGAGSLLFFREEQAHTRRWAGEPAKLLSEDERGPKLSPRHSFASWEEEVRGTSAEWTRLEQEAAMDLAEDLAVAMSSKALQEANARLEEEQEALREANRQLEELASTDSLTGVWNRYHLEASIDTEISAAQRYERPCGVILFDIDHFKHFNDTHGHEAGDRVLKEVTAAVAGNLRDTDHLGRWGGEEFLVLVTNSDLDNSARLAERLRQAVTALDLGELGSVTASFGVAGYRDGDSRRSLVKRADLAMYRAKEAGRNRVVVDSDVD